MNLNPMNLFRKSATYTVEQLAGLAELIGYSTSSNENINERTALETSAVLCAVRVLSEDVAKMPCRLIEETYDAKGVARTRIAREHWAHRLLSRRPNSWQTPYEFKEGMMTSAVLDGGALAIKVRSGKEVRELIPAPMGSWSVEQDNDFGLVFRVTMSNGQYAQYTEKDVLYFRGPSLDNVQGLRAIRLAREAIGLTKALEKQQAQIAGKGGRPSGVLSFAESRTPETIDKIRTSWAKQYGSSGAGGIAVLDGGAKFQPITMSAVDSQTLESRRLQVEEIARVFRVQPILLMQADKAATYASAEQMFRVHVTHTLAPWLRRFEEALNRDILALADGLRFDFDERAMLRGDHADQAEYYVKAIGDVNRPGWMTVNEVRIERDLNPIEEDWANEIPNAAITGREPAAEATSSLQGNDAEA